VQHLGSADAFAAAAIVVVAAALGAIATRLLIALLRRGGVLDRPNERSSHSAPTPRGGGIAVVGTVLVFWLGLAAGCWVTPRLVAVALAALLLAAVSWLDDLRDLPPLLRLIAQAAAVATGLAALPAASVDAAWFGSTAALPTLGIVWLWWVNLYNFMDGIDGIAGCETAAIGGGLLAFTAIGRGTDASVALLAAPILGAALGFLLWNWAPARIFLGDVGSVPLGYLTGYLLLSVAVAGAWRIAAILPLYFFADATITLGRRLRRGERVWQAHRQHFYQQAVRRGLNHAAVVKRVIVTDLLLIACGWASENGAGAAALPVAAAIVAALLASLAGSGRTPAPP
jgi:UDP-N-acetylmuramyl pentapeptide phosphotransferase/UDP-N-acetylglucosamine-1-phosphate transferase